MTNASDQSVADRVRAAVARRRDERGALLPILHAVQDELGCVPDEAIGVIAAELNISRADVHGVVTFYRDFRDTPAGRTTVRICRAEACQSLGANELVACAQDETGLAPGQTTGAGSLTVDQVFCLGNCALGPAVQVNGRLYGRVDAARLRSILTEAVSS